MDVKDEIIAKFFYIKGTPDGTIQAVKRCMNEYASQFKQDEQIIKDLQNEVNYLKALLALTNKDNK